MLLVHSAPPEQVANLDRTNVRWCEIPQEFDLKC
jgi:hypothetical protein